MMLSKKINNNIKTRRRYGGIIPVLRGGAGSNPPPQPISADNVRLFNSLNMGWQITPDSTDYEIFNIASNSDDVLINRAYRTFANTVRPFTQNKSPDKKGFTALRNILINKRNNLLDPNTRRDYDALLLLYPKNMLPPRIPPRTPPGTPPGTPRMAATVTFSDTQEPNPLLKRGEPIPPPIITTVVGGRLLAFIQDLNNKMDDGTIPEEEHPVALKIINITEKMLEYPESSNLENYPLFTLFLERADLSHLIVTLGEVLQNNKSRIDISTGPEFNINEIIQDPLQPHVNGKIDPTRFFSLMVLSSRLCAKYNLRSNTECELYQGLNKLFVDGDGPNFNSAGISDEIERFMRKSTFITKSYIKNLVNGERLYEIYRRNYLISDREISKGLIKDRVNKWVKVVPINERIYDIPVSYIFNKYTNAEKTALNKDLDICNAISEQADIIGKKSTPDPLLPPSVFNIEQNDSIDFDKINEFLFKLSPAAVKKKQLKSASKKSLLPSKPGTRKSKV